MLSILIPTYNYDCTALLEQLLKQLLSSKSPIEIVICDDASTNKQTKKANTVYCAYNKLLYIENSTNLGRTATRNKLAKKAQYDWLLFLDADVLLEREKFIVDYIRLLDNSHTIISGGTSYNYTQPKGKELRWHFGNKREARNATERMKNPYFIISQNLLIKKDVFLKLNTIHKRGYGLDNLFSYQIQQHKIAVLHIDNPVIHYGLEKNDLFLNKSIKAIETLAQYEKSKKVNLEFTRLQKSYKRLNSIGLKGLYKLFIKPFTPLIRKNLIGKKPSLFLFDLYRLYHYIQLRSNA